MGTARDAIKLIGKTLHGSHGLGMSATYTAPGSSEAIPICPTMQEELDDLVLQEVDQSRVRLARCRISCDDIAAPVLEASIDDLPAPYNTGPWIIQNIRPLPSGDHSVTISQKRDSATVHNDHGNKRSARP